MNNNQFIIANDPLLFQHTQPAYTIGVWNNQLRYVFGIS